jgi:hypothetical protein
LPQGKDDLLSFSTGEILSFTENASTSLGFGVAITTLLSRRKEHLACEAFNPAHRRRALDLLASSPHGATEKLLVVAHGFDSDMIAGLVRAGLATARHETVEAGGKTIRVKRYRITNAGG